MDSTNSNNQVLPEKLLSDYFRNYEDKNDCLPSAAEVFEFINPFISEMEKLIIESYFLMEILAQPQHKYFLQEKDRLKIMTYLTNLKSLQDKIKTNARN